MAPPRIGPYTASVHAEGTDSIDPFLQFPESLASECVDAWRELVSRPERSRELASRAFATRADARSAAWSGACLAYHHTRMAQLDQAAATIEQARAMFETACDARGNSVADVALSYLDIMRGGAEHAIARLEPIAQSHARSPVAAPLDQFLTCHALALAHGRQGHVDRVLHYHYVNLLLLEQSGSPPPLAVVLLNLSSTLAAIDDWEPCLQLAQRAVVCCETFDNPTLKRRAEINVALAQRFLGRIPEALELLAKLRDEAFGDPGSDFALYINSAETSTHHGDLDDARRWLDRARQCAVVAGDAHENANLRWISGWIAAKNGDLAEAVALLEQARTDVIALRKIHVPLLPRIVAVLAACHARSGEPARAFETYRSFHETYEARLGYTTRARYTGDKSRRGVAAIRAALADSPQAAAADRPAQHARLNEALRLTLGGERAHEGGALASWSADAIERLDHEARRLGINAGYMGGVVEGLREVAHPASIKSTAHPVRVYALGRFEVRVRDAPLRFGRKQPARPLMLLKYLATHGMRELPEAQVADALWPGQEGDAAASALAVNIHRLRRLLGDGATVVHRAHRVALDTNRVWCDTLAFEWLLDEAAAEPQRERRHALVERAVALYQGDLEIDEDRETWALAARERLRSRFVRTSAADGAWLSGAGRWEEARACYARALDHDERAEELCLGLMHCCIALGRPVEGIAAYRRLQSALQRHSGARPAAALEALYSEMDRRPI